MLSRFQPLMATTPSVRLANVAGNLASTGPEAVRPSVFWVVGLGFSNCRPYGLIRRFSETEVYTGESAAR
jgi:hypothetical protein